MTSEKDNSSQQSALEAAQTPNQESQTSEFRDENEQNLNTELSDIISEQQPKPTETFETTTSSTSVLASQSPAKKKRVYEEHDDDDPVTSFNHHKQHNSHDSTLANHHSSTTTSAKRHHSTNDNYYDRDRSSDRERFRGEFDDERRDHQKRDEYHDSRIGFADQISQAHPPLPPPVTTYSANPSNSSIGPHYSTHDNQNLESSKSVRFRILVSSKDAGVIIGHKGAHVNEIKEKIGLLIRVSPQVPNVSERIVTLVGPLHGLGRTVAFIAQKLMDRDLQKEGGRALVYIPLRVLVPACKMGFLIGKGGCNIKELQKSSGAQIFSEDINLPNSTERIMTIKGDAEALQIACYTIASMVGSEEEAMNMPPQVLYDPGFRPPIPMMAPMMGSTPYGSSSNRSYDNRGGGGNWRSGKDYSQGRDYSQGKDYHQQRMPSAPYGSSHPPAAPMSAFPDTSNMSAEQKAAMNAYYLQMQQMQMMFAQNPQMAQQYQQYYSQMMTGAGQMPAQMGVAAPSMEGSPVMEKINVPHEFVGKIIGKGGANTKEIKFRTGSDVKIADHVEGETERVCQIYGTPEGNKKAVALIHERIAFERSRPARNGSIPYKKN